MFEYIFIFIVVIGTAVFFNIRKRSDETERLWLGIVVLLSLAMTGLRDMIGGHDVFVYKAYFDGVTPITKVSSVSEILGNSFDFEPMYVVLCMTIKEFTDNFYAVLFITSAISYILLYQSIKSQKYSTLIFLILFSKFFIVGFIYIRQFIALSLVWLALSYLNKGDQKKFIWLTIISSTFHVSSLAVLVMLLFRKRHVSLKLATSITLIALIVGISNVPRIFMNQFGHLISSDKLIMYTGADDSGATHALYLMEILALLILLATHYKVLSAKMSPVYFNLFFLYVVITALFLREPDLIRFQWPFYLGVAIFITTVLHNFRLISLRPLLFLAILSFYGMFFFRGLLLRDEGEAIPYKATFQDKYRESLE